LYDIKIRKLGWVGHIMRKDERIPKKVLNGKVHNTRPVGKPRTRWEDVLKDTAPILGIRGWRQAENREEWRCFLGVVRVQKGL
jgi:hypothetical protein